MFELEKTQKNEIWIIWGLGHFHYKETLQCPGLFSLGTKTTNTKIQGHAVKLTGSRFRVHTQRSAFSNNTYSIYRIHCHKMSQDGHWLRWLADSLRRGLLMAMNHDGSSRFRGGMPLSIICHETRKTEGYCLYVLLMVPRSVSPRSLWMKSKMD